MATAVNDWYFLQSFVNDEDRLEGLAKRLLKEAKSEVSALKRSLTPSISATERLKLIIEYIGYHRVQESGDSRRILKIYEHCNNIRKTLSDPNTWEGVFRHFDIPLSPPITVEAIKPPGRCNFIYRVRGREATYIVRYHDPIGREFLQRHEPARAAWMYRAAAELFSECLVDDKVVEVLFPKSEIISESSLDESHTCTKQLIAYRSVVLRELGKQYFPLYEYRQQRVPMKVNRIVELFVRPLAQLHAHSRGITQEEPTGSSTAFRRTFARYRHLRRFDDADAYLRWLKNRNWITTRVLGALSRPRSISTLSKLLSELGICAADFLDACNALWQASADGVRKDGALVYLDHNPRNCFVERDSQTLVLFDFDYVAVLDPAYDIGLSLNSLIRFTTQAEEINRAHEVGDLCGSFLRYYRNYYRASEDQAVDLDGLIARSRAFAGLALAVTLCDNELNRIDSVLGKPTQLTEAQLRTLWTAASDLLRTLVYCF